MPVHRQTQSYLRNLFARRGIAPQHRYGQNFLIDLNIHELIANAADVGPDDVVLEVGPGAGALTALMASRGAAVVAVEIDPGMARLTADATAGMPNVRIVVGDALANKHTMHPEVLDNLRAGLAVDPGRRLKLVANLPYNVATPIVSNLLVHPELCPSLMVVTIQLELAERMRAEPGTDAYGSLSVIVPALADCSIVRVLPPSVFWPRPKVDSAVIAITPDPAKRAAIGDLTWFHEVVRKIFLHRRKNLRRVLYSLWRDRWTKEEVDAMLEGLGLTGLVRAEAMNVEELFSLTTALKARLGDDKDARPTEPDDDADTETDEDDAAV
jgi:16S rRNA (adenine1518-N6/adenine1519-N6)-dimethyltransferase